MLLRSLSSSLSSLHQPYPERGRTHAALGDKPRASPAGDVGPCDQSTKLELSRVPRIRSGLLTYSKIGYKDQAAGNDFVKIVFRNLQALRPMARYCTSKNFAAANLEGRILRLTRLQLAVASADTVERLCASQWLLSSCRASYHIVSSIATS